MGAITILIRMKRKLSTFPNVGKQETLNDYRIHVMEQVIDWPNLKTQHY